MLGESQPIEGCTLLLGTHLNGSGADFSSNAATPTETAMTWTQGRLGNQCGIFGGASDAKISYPNLAAYNITTACISVWFKTSYTGNYQYISCKNDNTPTGDNFYFGIGFATGQKLGYYNGGWKEAATSVCDGNWHNVVLVGAPSSGKIYLDGELDYSSSFNPFIATGSGGLLYIAFRLGDAGREFEGNLDEYMFMSGNPTAAAIKKYYTACKGRFGIL